tara:strand:+ start:1381 stop:1572 length:192 start_codon:yes stop_codon:yes gene_type:complete
LKDNLAEAESTVEIFITSNATMVGAQCVIFRDKANVREISKQEVKNNSKLAINNTLDSSVGST